MKRTMLIGGVAGVALAGLAVAGRERPATPSPTALSIAVVPGVSTATPHSGVASRFAMPTPRPTPSPSPGETVDSRDPPAHWAPGATNYAELGVLPPL